MKMNLCGPIIDLSRAEVPPSVTELVPETVAKRYTALPLRLEQKVLWAALPDPDDLEAIRDLSFCCGYPIRPVRAGAADIREAIERYYHPDDSIQGLLEGLGDGGETVLFGNGRRPRTIEDQHGEPPIIRLTDLLITKALKLRASDIHLEPQPETVAVRYRLDGLLKEEFRLPRTLQAAVTSRIKLMGNLDIAERRLPQDGAVRIRYRGEEVDLRIATMPTPFGEKVVVRVLDQSRSEPDLERLGFSPDDLDRMCRLLSRKQGILLVTGPTGSGKTTTLYAMIRKLRSETVNIVTVEDPIEYLVPGISQTQVHPDIGLTFASSLRSLLRQDPDIILLGEIRDLETAEAAFRAAMTGHLVLSTLHTNDAPSAVLRLVDLGLPRYLVASLVTGVVAQRLVRRNCTSCTVPYHPAPHLLNRLGLESKKPVRGCAARGAGVRGASEDVGAQFIEPPTPHGPPDIDVQFMAGAGCGACHGLGYRGRTAVFEVLEVTPRLQERISEGVTPAQLRAEAIGFRTLTQDGIRQVLLGITTPDEILRVLDPETEG